MKKNLLVLTLLATASTAGLAQKKNVTSAIMIAKARKPNFVKAKTYIDKATTHEDTKDQAKTWMWRANIYAGLVGSKSEAAAEIKKNTDVAAEVKKAMMMTNKLDTKGKFRSDLKRLAVPMYDATRNKASKSYNEKEFKVAFENFEASQDYAKILGYVDSAGLYYTGRAADVLKDYDNAIKYYEMSRAIEYGGADLYLNLAEAYTKSGKQAESDKVMEMAKTKFPDNANVILDKVKKLLSAKKPAEAKIELEKALAKDPNNYALQYAAGITYNEMEMYEDAINSYKKALEINPKDYNSKFNMSVVYNNVVAEMNSAVNEIDINETAKYDKAKAEMTAYINEVLPFVLATYEVEQEAAIKRILNNFYRLTLQNDKIMK
ncbi:MAG: tetratricopeptide repeat protein [Flavobacteriales bacterium]